MPPDRRAVAKQARAELDDPAPVMDAAAAFLAVRPRSVEETRRRLRHHGYPHKLVDAVVERLIEMNYLDDASFARLWIDSRDRARPRGEAALRRELGLRGVPLTIIDEALSDRQEAAEGGGADVAAAEALLVRRRASLERELDPRKRRTKAYALLARSGFDPETCRAAAASFVRAVGNN